MFDSVQLETCHYYQLAGIPVFSSFWKILKNICEISSNYNIVNYFYCNLLLAIINYRYMCLVK